MKYVRNTEYKCLFSTTKQKEELEIEKLLPMAIVNIFNNLKIL